MALSHEGAYGRHSITRRQGRVSGVKGEKSLLEAIVNRLAKTDPVLAESLRDKAAEARNVPLQGGYSFRR